jgi:hypothetical protein
LRTVFRIRDGQPWQEILPELEVAIEEMDLRELKESDRDSKALQLAMAEAEQGFDLAEGPLLRVKLVKIDEQDHVLMLTMHHIVSDGWSMGIMTKEFNRLYEAYLKEEENPLPEMVLQYVDYAVWEREWLQGEKLDEQLSYWKQKLAGVPELEIQREHMPGAIISHRSASYAFELPEELSRQIMELNRREGATLFMTLLAAWQVVLSWRADQEDFAIGTAIANRNQVETEGLIGFFINTLVMRTDLNGNPSIRELLRRVRQTALQAYHHQDLSFERLLEELQPQRKPGRNPIFQTTLVLQNIEEAKLSLPDLRVDSFDLPYDVSKLDLMLNMKERAGRLSGAIYYRIDLLSHSVAAALKDTFQELLLVACSHPEISLTEARKIVTTRCRALTSEQEAQLATTWETRLKSSRRSAAVFLNSKTR